MAYNQPLPTRLCLRSHLPSMRAPTLIAVTIALLLLTLSPPLAASGSKQMILLDPAGTAVFDPIQMIGTVIVRPDGSIEVTTDQPPACNTGGGCEGVQIGTPSFSAVKTSVEVGESLTFNWSSRGAWDCRAGGTLPGWNTRTGLPPNSAEASLAQRTVSTTSLAPGSYTATLLCENGPVQSNAGVPRALALTVNAAAPPDPGLPQDCSSASRRAPDTWVRLDTGNRSCHWEGAWLAGSDCRQWEGVWGDLFNPNGTGTTKSLGVRPSLAQGYIALRFNSGSFAPTHTGTFVVNSGTAGLESARKIISVSQCPGDFNAAAINDKQAGGTGCIWEVENRAIAGWGGTSTSQDCQLQPNTTYFFNIVFTEAPLEGLTWSSITPHPFCQQNNCGNLFRNR